MSRFFVKYGPVRIALMVVGGVVAASAFALFFGWIVMIVWNWVMPDIFGIKQIGYWQGFGLVLLARLLVGNMGPGHHGRGPQGGKHPKKSHREHLRHRLHDHFGTDFCMAGCRDDAYENFWNEEGKAAFDAYVKRKGSETQQP